MPNFEFMRDPTTLRTTEKVLAKNGLLCTNFQRKTEPEQKFFPLTKLRKKWKRKNFLRILLIQFSKTIFTPFFANTMLYDVLVYFFCDLFHLKTQTNICLFN